MQKGEGAGFGLSVVGHIGLLALLSLNLMSVRKLPKLSEPMDVMLVDKAGLTSAAPKVSKEAPQAAAAPEVAPEIQEAPPPQPAPPKPLPKAEPVPAPSPKPAPKTAKPEPAKPAPPVAKPAPPAPAKPVKSKATSLSTDFLKGIPVAKSTGKEVAPRAALSPIQVNGLQSLIAGQVKPCYTIPTGGTDIMSIVSKIRLRLKKDGSIAIAPELMANSGITSANQPYLRQMNEAAMRALQRCAPYKLPADLYEGGWDDIAFNFRPAQMN